MHKLCSRKEKKKPNKIRQKRNDQSSILYFSVTHF